MMTKQPESNLLGTSMPLTVAVSGEDEELFKKLLEIYLDVGRAFYFEGSFERQEREKFGPEWVNNVMIPLIKTWGIDQRLDENDKSFAALLPETQYPDVDLKDPDYIRVNVEGAHIYRNRRERELKAQKEGLQQ